jgi:hypothetical protein
MTIYDKANSVIGKPYDAYKSHCWHLVEYLQPLAPKLDVSADNLYKSVKHFDEEIEKNINDLDSIAEGFMLDGDIVLLGRGEKLFHAGVYLNNGVIHASDIGVVFERYAIIKQKYPVQKGLRCRHS